MRLTELKTAGLLSLFPLLSGCHLIAGLEDHALREDSPALSQWPDSISSYCSDGNMELECNPDKISDPGLLTQDSLVRYNLPEYTSTSGDSDIIKVHDSITGLTWYAMPAFQGDWPTASKACAEGFTDKNIRLPTRLELISIMDYASSEPRFAPDALKSLPQGEYLTNSVTKRFPNTDPVHPDEPQEVWFVRASCASVACAPGMNADSLLPTFRGYALNTNYRAICVQDTHSFKLADPLVQPQAGDLQWTDNRTGLTWTTQADTEVNWTEALSYCNTRQVLGKTGWRLPSIKEIQTIADDTDGNAYLIPFLPNNMTSATFWSSTPYMGGPAYAYIFTTPHGTVRTDITSQQYFRALCVRGPD